MRWRRFAPNSLILRFEDEFEQFLVHLADLSGGHDGNLREVIVDAQAVAFQQLVEFVHVPAGEL